MDPKYDDLTQLAIDLFHQLQEEEYPLDEIKAIALLRLGFVVSSGLDSVAGAACSTRRD